MPCHNRSFDLPRVLMAYEKQEGDLPFEVVAIDDGSNDDTLDVLRSFRPTRFSLRVERLPKSRGPAAARNLGISLAKAPLLLFVGDDILPTPRLVREHWKAHQVYPDQKIAILGRVAWSPEIPINFVMKHIDGVGAQQFSYFYLKDKHEYDFRHFYTANISVKRSFLEQCTPWFDTSFPYAAFEDAELAFRLSRRGLKIFYLADLVGYHYHYYTIWGFTARQYNVGRSAWLFIKKHPVVAVKLLRAVHKRSLLSAFLQRKKRTVLESLQQLEESLLYLASFCEWTPCPFADALFLATLDYFYFKGVCDAVFAANAPLALRARKAYIRLELQPSIERFIQFVPVYDRNILIQQMEALK